MFTRLAVLALVVGATQTVNAAEASGEVIFVNGRVFTAEPDRPYADAVAIRGDRIIAVGARSAVEAAAGSGAKHVDLQGKFLMPGMIDAHAHPFEGGDTLLRPRYSHHGDSVPALVQFVESKLGDKAALRGDTLVIYDLSLGFWPKTAEIEAALSAGKFAKRPIVLYGGDGHTAFANKAARAKAGITQAFIRKLSPQDRIYDGTDAQLNPNGFLVDDGRNRMIAALPPLTLEEMVKGGHAALEYMNGFGITGWLDAAVAGVIGASTPLSVKEPGFLPAYKAIGLAGELTAHVRAYPVVKPDAGVSQIDVVQQLQAQYQNIPNFKIPGLKVFADGVVEMPSQTAALTKPYLNSGRQVKPLFTAEQFNPVASEAYRRGLTVHIHAIGDLGVKVSLDAFEAVRKAVPDTKLPMVITHTQFVDPEDIPRFGQLKVIAALQLLWAPPEGSKDESVQPYVDPSIYKWQYPARSMLDSGAIIAGASDWFVSSPNPFLAIFQAETRTGGPGVFDDSQRMPREAMLYAYTRNAAAALDMSEEIGSIAVGKLADLVLVDRDVLTVSAKDLAATKVVWTMFGGKVVSGQSPL